MLQLWEQRALRGVEETLRGSHKDQADRSLYPTDQYSTWNVEGLNK